MSLLTPTIWAVLKKSRTEYRSLQKNKRPNLETSYFGCEWIWDFFHEVLHKLNPNSNPNPCNVNSQPLIPFHSLFYSQWHFVFLSEGHGGWKKSIETCEKIRQYLQGNFKREALWHLKIEAMTIKGGRGEKTIKRANNLWWNQEWGGSPREQVALTGMWQQLNVAVTAVLPSRGKTERDSKWNQRWKTLWESSTCRLVLWQYLQRFLSINTSLNKPLATDVSPTSPYYGSSCVLDENNKQSISDYTCVTPPLPPWGRASVIWEDVFPPLWCDAVETCRHVLVLLFVVFPTFGMLLKDGEFPSYFLLFFLFLFIIAFQFKNGFKGLMSDMMTWRFRIIQLYVFQ